MSAWLAKHAPKTWLYIGVALVLIVAVSRLFAVVGPPLAIWSIAHPRNSGVRSLPAAFQQYVVEIVKLTGMTEQKVHVLLFASAAVFGILAVLGVGTALRKRRARILLVGLCTCLIGYHAFAIAVARFSVGTITDQVGWLLVYSVVVLILTRNSVVRLFPSAQPPKAT